MSSKKISLLKKKARLKRKAQRNAERAERKEQLSEQQLDALEQKMRESSYLPELKVVRNVPGQEKMSAVLLEFLDPYIKSAQTKAEVEKLVAFGIIAWNAAIMPESNWQEILKKTTAGSPLDGRLFLKHLVADLIARKQKYFADNKRLIVSYTVSDLGNNWHVSVASTLAEGAQDV